MPVCVPCRINQSPRRESNPRGRHTRAEGYHYNTGAYQQSAQWESNPHFRHGKAAGSRYIMGAVLIQSVRRELHPRRRLGRAACLLLHHEHVQQGWQDSNPHRPDLESGMLTVTPHPCEAPHT